MSNYKLSDKGDVDIYVIDLLKTYFFEDIKWDIVYKNFGKLSIGKIHPFVRLLSDTNRARPKDVLPAITVALLDDTSNGTTLSKATEQIEMTKDILKELEDQKLTLNKPNAFRELYAHIDSLTGGAKLFATQTNRRYQQRLMFEIWADNDEVKDLLYEGIKDFIDFYGIELYNFGVENPSVNGKKDGDYNFDFGTILYGATVSFGYTTTNLIFDIDTDVVTIAGIRHHVEDTPDADSPDFGKLS